MPGVFRQRAGPSTEQPGGARCPRPTGARRCPIRAPRVAPAVGDVAALMCWAGHRRRAGGHLGNIGRGQVQSSNPAEDCRRPTRPSRRAGPRNSGGVPPSWSIATWYTLRGQDWHIFKLLELMGKQCGGVLLVIRRHLGDAILDRCLELLEGVKPGRVYVSDVAGREGRRRRIVEMADKMGEGEGQSIPAAPARLTRQGARRRGFSWGASWRTWRPGCSVMSASRSRRRLGAQDG